MTNQPKRSGFVSILGAPNAGKSTLVNKMVGAKVSIVSRKVQTTRCRIMGVAMHGQSQVILIDTPGIFEPVKMLERAMVGAAWSSLDDADVVIHLVDAARKGKSLNHASITSRIPPGKPVLLVLNKVDAVNKPALLALTQELNAAYSYAGTFMISALKGSGIEDLLNDLSARLPENDWIFDPEQLTDMPVRFLAAEITREKIYDLLHQELPYATYVETTAWEPFDNGSVKISQLVCVQRETQKAIVLGKGGAQIKKIGQMARLELEEFLGHKVHLKILVKVDEDWSEKSQTFRLLGLSGASGV